MKHIRIRSAEGHEIAGFRYIVHTLVPDRVTLKEARAAARTLGVKVEEINGPIFSGSIDGDEMISFTGCTLPEVARLLGSTEKQIRSAVAALPAEQRTEWEKMFNGESNDFLESENFALGFNSIHISGGK
jgi:hypothetical protein